MSRSEPSAPSDPSTGTPTSTEAPAAGASGGRLPVRRLEVGIAPEQRDPRGEDVSRAAQRFLGIRPGRVRTRDVYLVEGDVSDEEAARLAREISDPLRERAVPGRLEDGLFAWAVRVAYKAGVTDPVGKSARVAIEDILGRKLHPDAAVYTSILYLIDGTSREEAERIAWGILANPLIHDVEIRSWTEWESSPPDLTVPRVAGHERPPVERIDLAGSDADLAELSRSRLLSLTLPEMRAVRFRIPSVPGAFRGPGALGNLPDREPRQPTSQATSPARPRTPRPCASSPPACRSTARRTA